MKTRELANLGIPRGEVMKTAQKAVNEYAKNAKGSMSRNDLRQVVLNLVKNPEDFLLELEFADEPTYSADVVEMIMQGRRIDYNMLRTLNDMKLLQLGWVYDINFVATLRRIKQRGFLEMIFDFLPKTEDIEAVRKKILEYVDSRVN